MPTLTVPTTGGETFVTVNYEGRDIEVPIRLHPMAALPTGPTPSMDNGRIIIPRSQAEIDETIARWKKLGPQPVAHDLECAASPTVPNGTGLHPHLGTIRLAQFAVADAGEGTAEALVVDLWKHKPDAALELLASPEWPTIIHFAQMETRWLGYRYGLRIENLIDTRQTAQLVYDRHGFTAPPIAEDLQRLARERANLGEWLNRDGDGDELLAMAHGDLDEAVSIREDRAKKKRPAVRGPRFALGVVSERELDLKLDKTQQNSHWDAVRLTHEQLKYAGEDVLSLHDIYRRHEPLLTGEDRVKLYNSARNLNDKAAGVTEEEAARRRALAAEGFPEQEGDEKATASVPVPKGCESARAQRMIAACRSKSELAKLRKSLPYMRIHFTNQDAVQAAVERRAAELEQGVKAPRPVKVKVAGWQQPY